MAANDLITLARAQVNLYQAPSSDNATISTLITTASRAIAKYCRRDFIQTTYDELYNGNGDRRLMLRQYPLCSVQSVRYRPVTAMKVINNNSSAPQARVTVTSTGITLLTVIGGTPTTVNLAFATYPTVGALETAVNSVGASWSCQSQGYDAWPSADLYCPMGPSGATGTSPSTQGALTGAGQFAELKLHTYELAGYQLGGRKGVRFHFREKGEEKGSGSIFGKRKGDAAGTQLFFETAIAAAGGSVLAASDEPSLRQRSFLHRS